MATTMISARSEMVTVVNVFTVSPDHQQALVELLERATAEVMCVRRGFVSANIHKSLDGLRVLNYAQWTSHETYEAMLADRFAQSHLHAAAELGISESHLYRVESVYHV